MLVLTRRIGEVVRYIVPPSATETVIDVTLVDIRGTKVRLGSDAPRAVTIHRVETLSQDDLKDDVLGAFDALAEASAGHWDGVDAQAYVQALREGA